MILIQISKRVKDHFPDSQKVMKVDYRNWLELSELIILID